MSYHETSYQQISTEELVRLRNLANSSIQLQQINAELSRRAAAAERVAREVQVRLDNNISSLNHTIQGLNIRNNELTNAVHNANQNIANMHREHVRQIETMRRDYTDQIHAMDEHNRRELQQLENRFATDLTRSEQQMRADFNSTIMQTRHSLQQEISESSARMNARITAVRNSVNQQIRQVNATVSSIERQMDGIVQTLNTRVAQERQLHEQAEDFFNAAQTIIEQTDAYNEENQHNWHSQDRNNLSSLIDSVQINIDGGNATASVAREKGRELFQQALTYRENVFAAEMQWRTVQEMTAQMVSEVSAFCNSRARVQIKGEEVDVDYWTCGELDRIRQRIRALDDQLTNPQVTSEQMEYIRELAMQYRREADEAVNFAINAVQLSYDREDLLRDAVEVLQRRHFMVQRWAERYAGDRRLGFRVYMVNQGNGMEIVLTGEPMPGDNGEIRNVYRSEILCPASDMHNAQDVHEFNSELMRDLDNQTGAVFAGQSTCSHPNEPVENVGQANRDTYVTVSAQQIQWTLQQQATPRLKRQHEGQAARD